MKRFDITKNDEGQRVDKFISKAVPALPKSLMYKYIRLKRIKLNSKRTAISDRLREGDVIEMYINDEFFVKPSFTYDFLKSGKELDIIYEDENILLADKKAGVLCHPDGREYSDTLISRIKRYLYEKGEYNPEKENSFTPALANRIDRNTSGIVICAKNAESLRILNRKIRDRELKKLYLCIVLGQLKKQSSTLTGYLKKDESKNTVSVNESTFTGAKEIKTKYRVLEERKNFSLLEIELLTGRTHQIRAHLAHIGHPLLGDNKYGKKEVNKKTGFMRQALCSYKLFFDFTSDSGALNYLNGKEFTAKNVQLKTDFYNL